MNEQQLTSHLVSKISTMDVESKPFPYFFIDDLLPNDVFSELRSSFPVLRLDAEKSGSVYKTVEPLHSGISGDLVKGQLTLVRMTYDN